MPRGGSQLEGTFFYWTKGQEPTKSLVLHQDIEKNEAILLGAFMKLMGLWTLKRDLMKFY